MLRVKDEIKAYKPIELFKLNDGVTLNNDESWGFLFRKQWLRVSNPKPLKGLYRLFLWA